VTALSDAVLSTGGMLRYVKESAADEFIIGTETGILYSLRKQNPGKTFYPASEQAVCPNMKLTTPEKILWSLEDMATVVAVPEEIAGRARRAIERMLKVGRQD
jgi:quinolinate synthase